VTRLVSNFVDNGFGPDEQSNESCYDRADEYRLHEQPWRPVGFSIVFALIHIRSMTGQLGKGKSGAVTFGEPVPAYGCKYSGR